MKQQILCVDESTDNCELFSFILSGAGYEIQVTHTVAEGLQMAKNNAFKLYLIDLSFSDGNGLDLIEKIRVLDAATPIVVCSGNGREWVQAEAIQLGAQAFLLKPIDPDVLEQTINKILGNELQN